MTLPPVYPILDTHSLSRRGFAPARFAAALLEGGAALMQFRHKGDFTREAYAAARAVAALCRGAGVPLIIDDRADIALLLDAGVHLGQNDLPPAEARRILGQTGTIGFSTHNREQFLAAAGEPADYLALGPIFGTASKDTPDPTLGLDALRELRPLDARPLVAIGGITRANARDVWRAGASTVAVIADLFPEPLTELTLRQRMEEWISLNR
jgi:thiamine-phosphate pyrophosphorylase